MLRTIVDAWYAGVDATSSVRLVTRNSISLVFPLPLNYAQRMRQVDGVTGVSWGNWFGGVYVSERNFFPQFAVDAASYLDLYPEYVLPAGEQKAFLADRQGVVVGRKLADRFGWKVGDQIPLRGTIYPGTWTFTLRGIYDGVDAKTDENAVPVPLGIPERDRQEALRPARRPGRVLHRAAAQPRRRGRRVAADRRVLPQLARRDADRDREGVPARRSSR